MKNIIQKIILVAGGTAILSYAQPVLGAGPLLLGIQHVLTYGGGACSIVGAAIAIYDLINPPANCGTTGLTASQLRVQATETTFDLSLIGGDFDSNNLNVPFSGTASGIFDIGNNNQAILPFWKYQFLVNEDAGVINDVLSINGSLQHVYQPHPPADTAPGPIMPFNLIVDADNAVGGKVSDTDAVGPLQHPTGKHTDSMNAKLTATVTSTGPFDDITGYTFTLEGRHKPTEIKRKVHDPKKPGSGDLKESLGSLNFDGGTQLSFSSIVTDSLFLNGGAPSVGDPLLGSDILISNTNITPDPNGNGWFADDVTYQVISGGNSVITASGTDCFLFRGGGAHPEYDSEFQCSLENFLFNNTIASPFIDSLEDYTNAGGSSFLTMFTNIISQTDDLSLSGSSEGITWVDGSATVPETTPTLSILALGTLGVASMRKRKLSSSISTEKETKQVG